MTNKQIEKEITRVRKALGIKKINKFKGIMSENLVPAKHISIETLTAVLANYIEENHRTALKTKELCGIMDDVGIDFWPSSDLLRLVEAKKFRYEECAGLNQIRVYI